MERKSKMFKEIVIIAIFVIIGFFIYKICCMERYRGEDARGDNFGDLTFILFGFPFTIGLYILHWLGRFAYYVLTLN